MPRAKKQEAFMVTVKEKFIDKHTRGVRKVGDVIEVTQERFDEIAAAGEFVEKQEAAKPADSSSEKQEAAE